jgi:hypothetical protein
VYKVLDPLRLTLPRGRLTDVGVGGLSLAGMCSHDTRIWLSTNAAVTRGVSYLAPRISLAIDQIVSVQKVLASGKVVNTHDRQYADLARLSVVAATTSE